MKNCFLMSGQDRECYDVSNVSKPLIMITKATRREVTGKGKTRQRCAALRFGPLLLLPKNIFASNALFLSFQID